MNRRPKRALIGVACLMLLIGLALVMARTSSQDEPAARPPSGTFVASVPGSRAVLWAVGDGADGSSEAKAVTEMIRSRGVDRLLYLGDVYDSGGISGLLTPEGGAADFREQYATVYGELGRRTAPTIGNHEWDSRQDGYNAYWARTLGSRTPDYYAFRAGRWEVLSLNSELAHGPRSAQLRWLESKVSTPGTCRLAFWHRPRFSAGRHGDQPDVEPLWSALSGHAALVVNGHDHDMQRLRAIDGLTEYVSGAGGHSSYRLREDRRVAFGDDTHDGALRIELRRGRADLSFVASDGEVLDRSRVRCRSDAA